MNAPYLIQKPGWIARILITLTTVALVIVGFFFLTVALVVGALIALVIGVRLWWLIRKIKRAQPDSTFTSGASGEQVVDGEYQVVERESSAQQLPPAPHDPEPRKDTNSTTHR
jgi:predicted lipid-binding transport protein (Tim44 family)